ncbi:polysaccharide deacetylase family protein [Actinoplanes sp. RD1]|uniref:polysaccharide deacetylase family protein n=1 Tax=Actinoplanes sp. RD1 TaxID=3064538 RepID=UPI0027422014|nr:polysaccharide deacetylase family protein [Actinoplanes sp. RD1]
MRGAKLYVIGLALAGLAGCGTALAAENAPTWVVARPVTTPATSASTPESPSATADEEPPTSATAPATPSSAPVSDTSPAPASSAPDSASASASVSPAGPAEGAVAQGHHGGPANSLMVTGTEGVALTFDDGPDPATTPELLDLLAEHQVKATFCLVGENVEAFPDLVRRIAAEGHTLCNHTWDHSLTLGTKKPAVIRADLEKTNAAIRAAVPGAEIKYMRAPGGNFTPNFVKVANELGMIGAYWQVDTRDWDHSGGESDSAHVANVIKAVKHQTTNGAIILSHDYAQPDTIAAYRKLLPWLKTRYTLIPLP